LKIDAVVDGAITTDPDIVKMTNYLQCAEAFGWTPEETDRVESYLLEEMLVAHARVKKREME
jgi:hypothetical protein